MIQFTPESHQYTSLIPDGKKWQSVTTVIGSLHEKFDPIEGARKSSNNRKSKWYKMSEAEILQAWESEKNRSTELGTWYHNMRELNLYKEGLNSQGMNVIMPIYSNDIKVASDQKLVEGIYPEHMVYLESAGLCGQVDKLEVIGNTVNINDYKTCKDIKKESYVNWEGVSKKMLKPVQHLPDCQFYHYALQLSLYMYMVIRHNLHLTPGKMVIEHVKFKLIGEDKYGYPLYQQNEDGSYVVTDIEEIEVPYLERECKLIVDKLKAEQHAGAK